MQIKNLLLFLTKWPISNINQKPDEWGQLTYGQQKTHQNDQHWKKHKVIKKEKHPACLMPGEVMSLSGKAEDSPGPDPAPEPRLLPSDLSSDWPTGGEGW